MLISISAASAQMAFICMMMRGKTYLDFSAGYGALNLGHNPPEVLEAVRKASSLPSILLAGYNPLKGALAANLSELLPGTFSIYSSTLSFKISALRASIISKRYGDAASQEPADVFLNFYSHPFKIIAMII